MHQLDAFDDGPVLPGIGDEVGPHLAAGSTIAGHHLLLLRRRGLSTSDGHGRRGPHGQKAVVRLVVAAGLERSVAQMENIVRPRRHLARKDFVGEQPRHDLQGRQAGAAGGPLAARVETDHLHHPPEEGQDVERRGPQRTGQAVAQPVAQDDAVHPQGPHGGGQEGRGEADRHAAPRGRRRAAAGGGDADAADVSVDGVHELVAALAGCCPAGGASSSLRIGRADGGQATTTTTTSDDHDRSAPRDPRRHPHELHQHGQQRRGRGERLHRRARRHLGAPPLFAQRGVQPRPLPQQIPQTGQPDVQLGVGHGPDRGEGAVHPGRWGDGRQVRRQQAGFEAGDAGSQQGAGLLRRGGRGVQYVDQGRSSGRGGGVGRCRRCGGGSRRRVGGRHRIVGALFSAALKTRGTDRPTDQRSQSSQRTASEPKNTASCRRTTVNAGECWYSRSKYAGSVGLPQATRTAVGCWLQDTKMTHDDARGVPARALMYVRT